MTVQVSIMISSLEMHQSIPAFISSG